MWSCRRKYWPGPPDGATSDLFGTKPRRVTKIADDSRLSSPAHSRSPRSFHDHPFGWDESKLATHLDQPPTTLMHEAIVVVTQQH